jgi:hypothetical protein
MTGIRFKTPFKDRRCFNCKSDKTYLKKNGNPVWRIVDNNIWCHKCWAREIWNPIANKITNPKRMQFKDKRIYINDKEKLKGQCEQCGKKIGDEFINCFGKKTVLTLTHTHHIDYHDNNPLKDTIELCTSCHGKENKGKKHKK